MDITRRRLLMLLPAAAVAWQYVQAGTPEAAPNYKTTDHWWGMIIDIDKCIGCGNCVRACSNENDVPRGLLPHLGRALRGPRGRSSSPEVNPPTAPSTASRRPSPPSSRASSSPSSATTAPIPPACRSAPSAPPSSARMASCSWTRLTAWAAATACRPAPTAAATCTPRTKTVDKCTLCYHRITQGLTTACCENCPTGARQLVDFKESQGPGSRVPARHKVRS